MARLYGPGSLLAVISPFTGALSPVRGGNGRQTKPARDAARRNGDGPAGEPGGTAWEDPRPLLGAYYKLVVSELTNGRPWRGSFWHLIR